MKKNLSNKEKAERKRGRKAGIIAICCVIVIAPLIWFAREYFATESLVDYRTTEINGDTLSIILTEKTSTPHRGLRNANDQVDPQDNSSHFGYFLELYDSVANKSLDKIEFDTPVWHIQNTPELRVLSNGTIWVVSTSFFQSHDTEGFVLKFAIEKNKIVEKDFVLDEKYNITGLDEMKVIMNDGTSMSSVTYDSVWGNIYLDLETGKIVDGRKNP